MKKRLMAALVALFLMAVPLTSFAQEGAGRTIDCDDGGTFSNGVAVTVIQMRTGFNYTATAIGLNGFDPIVAVLDSSGEGLCTDDDTIAATYSADLPTTGEIDSASTNSQVIFANTGNNAFEDISIVVGGYDSQPGEFLLIIEGMASSAADGPGDPFSVEITPGMVGSGVNVTAYVISVTNVFDPNVFLVDADYEYIADDDDNYIGCDDAGNSSLCWGESFDLSGSFVSRTQNRQLPGGGLDAMLSIPMVAGMEGGFLNFLVSGTQGTYGDYVMAFHVASTEPTAAVNPSK